VPPSYTESASPTRGVFVPLATAVLLAAGCDSRSGPVAVPEVSPAARAVSSTACGELGCRQYDSLAEAFKDALVLARPSGSTAGASTPLILAVGEAHAQKGALVPSSASRFASDLLPLLAGRASDLLVEIQAPPAGCTKVTREVKKKQEVVTTAQASNDQNEYVAMGTRARALGIIPDVLRPACSDLDAIEAAGDEAIDVSLKTIERLTLGQVEKLVTRAQASPADQGKMVVTYGGALHNALHPTAERAAWSFGPALDAFTQGRYIELDLYVPEFMDDSEPWKRLPFYSHYDRVRMGKKTTMFRDGNSVVIIFPMTQQRGQEPP